MDYHQHVRGVDAITLRYLEEHRPAVGFDRSDGPIDCDWVFIAATKNDGEELVKLMNLAYKAGYKKAASSIASFTKEMLEG